MEKSYYMQAQQTNVAEVPGVSLMVHRNFDNYGAKGQKKLMLSR